MSSFKSYSVLDLQLYKFLRIYSVAFLLSTLVILTHLICSFAHQFHLRIVPSTHLNTLANLDYHSMPRYSLYFHQFLQFYSPSYYWICQVSQFKLQFYHEFFGSRSHPQQSSQHLFSFHLSHPCQYLHFLH